ncbi:MAG: hypothetical protein A2Y64_01200 [Candidatus Coatesbacteria bacterium RBG_13_66_14]|uniref:BioF2-like acetyltransferase domain-containing protein n=1 Tax=Candidatus Coatesbacteria bacterium RBG_13_66_14 TaxID=1817816 RepID=A0A1F5FGP7_9BACT|nr:MAG: hypothetical protein A2Y64_01200 [Candidatus Coatesbacteria bacterium RBG_13_66_14]
MADFEVGILKGDWPILTGLGAYYLTGYLDAVRETYRGAVELYAVSSGGETRALFPLLREGDVGVLPPLGQYWGIWEMPITDPAPGRAESVWEKTVRAVDAYLRGLGLAEAAFIHPPHATDARPFLRLGWEVIPRYTYLVHPSGEDAWDSSTRRQLKKSRESGVEVRVAESWETLYRLHREGMARQRLPHAPEPLVKGLASRGTIFQTETSAVLLGKDAASGYYALAASDPAGHGDGSPTALVARVLEELGKDGKNLDFVGANTEKLCRFKRGFGGRLVPYFQTRAVFTKTRRFLKGLRRVLRGD